MVDSQRDLVEWLGFTHTSPRWRHMPPCWDGEPIVSWVAVGQREGSSHQCTGTLSGPVQSPVLSEGCEECERQRATATTSPRWPI